MSIAASQWTETGPHNSRPVEEDPMVFESRAKGDDLRETMTQMDMFEEDIRKGYTLDPVGSGLHSCLVSGQKLSVWCC